MTAMKIAESLLHDDVLYLGGGNAVQVTAARAENIHIASSDAVITGGIHLWDAGYSHTSSP